MSELIIKKSNNQKYKCHESSYIDNGAEIGEGTIIWHFSHVMKNAKIGKQCTIGQNCYIGNNTIIGNKVKIQNNVSIYNSVKLDDKVFCGPSCVFTNVINPRSFIERKNEFKTTYVKKGASIGANATIICGNIIGKYAFIGAGALIAANVPNFALMVGIPAKQTGWVCKCGIKLDESLKCEGCGNEYQLIDNNLILKR
jgi:UDP-2-acetamido-3-amino-2,3-dideoxy-glucuronate N-acetyltransferase